MFSVSIGVSCSISGNSVATAAVSFPSVAVAVISSSVTLGTDYIITLLMISACYYLLWLN